MYSETNLKKITLEYEELLKEFHKLSKSIVVQGQALTNARVKEHVLHGVGRRIFVLRRAVENIFTFFSPGTTALLKRDTLYDVQINLHAFTMNLYGVFENCAWAFVVFHDLEQDIGNRLGISLFKTKTKEYLPESLKFYLNSSVTVKWHKYLKSYRDSLAHRIPLYIPPANFTDEDTKKYKSLEKEQMECFSKFANGDENSTVIDRAEEISQELEAIGSPSPFFLHSLTEDNTEEPIFMHLQLIIDSKAIIEFLDLFLKEWQEKVELT